MAPETARIQRRHEKEQWEMIDVIEERPTIKEIADFYGVEPQAHQ